MDKSRGAAKRLAQEAKDRKQVDREKPRVRCASVPLLSLFAKLTSTTPHAARSGTSRPHSAMGSGERTAVPRQWRLVHRRPRRADPGGGAREGEQEGAPEHRAADAHELTPTIHRSQRAKMGMSASAARPLKPQHTGAAAPAPLKRQMTGASARSTSSSTSTGPPAAKRLAAGSVAPTPAAARIARPKSVLGDANGLHYTPSATPAPLKPQMTGRARSGTLSASVAQTPLSASQSSNGSMASSVGLGMRIPAGWGASAAGTGSPAMSPTLGTAGVGVGGARGMLLPQPTGGHFRPMGR